MNRIKKITLILLVVALAVASALSLCACNEQADDDGDVVRNLYIYTIKFSGDEENSDAPSGETSAFDEQTDRVATVYVGFSKTDRQVEGASAVWHSDRRKDGEFYFVTETTISLNPIAIFSAVKESVPQEDLVYNDVEYNRLKVVLRYDTIYKSIKSDGEITRAGRTYTHVFALDESLENDVITLKMRSPNSANWYATLVCCALAIVLIALVATLSVKGAKWQKTKTKE